MKWSALKACVAMVVIGALEWKALEMGINGQLFGVVVAAIAGLAGYTLGKKTNGK